MQKTTKTYERRTVRNPSGKTCMLEIQRSNAGLIKVEGDKVARLYIDAFSGPPWYEKYRVRVNGEWTRMGSPEELAALKQLQLEGRIAEKDVEPFYTVEGVKASMTAASAADGFIISLADVPSWYTPGASGAAMGERPERRIIGASWGMAATSVPSKEKLKGITAVIDSYSLPAQKTFYLDETFVDIEYRGEGIGKALVEIRGSQAIESGFEYAIVRTINPVQVGNLSSVFGKENMKEAYSNPEDMQPDRRYYLIDLRGMKRHD
ncbi:MAG: hypothetical protein KGH69_00890 [Candidatus Micrarchaeota archaeon]|nr:hypothetical protein [Candidatus Micrarchaeota archaeon]